MSAYTTSSSSARIKLTPHSYEGLPPNFSLAANMAAGAFAGIAVRLFDRSRAAPAHNRSRNTQSCTPSIC